MLDAERHYRALVEEWFTDWMSLTFSRGVDIQEAAAAFGNGIDTDCQYNYREAIEEGKSALEAAGIGCTAIVGELGDWTVTAEPAGYQGNLWHVQRGLSARDRSISVLCAFGTYNLTYAVQSEVVANIQLWNYSESAESEHTEISGIIEGLCFDSDDLNVRTSALMLCERITEERLGSVWLNQRHRWLKWEDPE